VCVCLSVRELHVRSSPNFVVYVIMVVARSSSGGVLVMLYVLPVLWMTS